MNANYSNSPYGWDRLSKVLLIGGLFLCTSKWSAIMGVLIMGYAFWRTRSRNVEIRRREGMAYESLEREFVYKVRGFIGKAKGLKWEKWMEDRKVAAKERKQFVIVSCPTCGQKLRLPRGKGKIVVTCARCTEEFRSKT